MPHETSPQNGLSARRLAPLGLLVAAGIAFVAAGGHHYLTFATLAENRDWLGNLVQRWGFVAALIYIAVYAGLVALSVPGAAVLTITGGFLFGTWLGTLCAVVGATLGATGIFLAARVGLGGLARRAGPLAGNSSAIWPRRMWAPTKERTVNSSIVSALRVAGIGPQMNTSVSSAAVIQ